MDTVSFEIVCQVSDHRSEQRATESKLLILPRVRDSTCAQDGESEAEFLPDDFEEKPEREKKHTNFTLCNVCNIQLNSAAQAQIHYNGKSHQKRLKQLSNGMAKNDNVRPALYQVRFPPASVTDRVHLLPT
ncbi:hypothetical protein CB1_002077001 [Camelus ferus]|nr:hypothetical protein CB1_002077001 [Camelus ferus]